MRVKTVLLADDDAAIRTVLTQALSRAGYAVKATGNAATLWGWIADSEGDLVVTDVVMPDESAFDMLPRIKKIRKDLPIIVMSAKNTIMTAITAAERGAYEYLPKPFDLNKLLQLCARALEERPAKSPPSADGALGTESLPLIGRSAAMQEVYRIIARMVQTDLTVMIIGESGTGKELAARALHDYGRRKTGPFIAVNMAAIPRELIESELFGHERGAFTGAQARHSGRFEQAQGGTLFLDEIGDMPMEAQTRLLRVLQEGEFSPIGASRSIKTDIRIIAATHRDLRQLISQGLFREDLYFRLNVVPVRLPPLRERLDDLSDLAHYFLARAERNGLPKKLVSVAAVERLQQHRWPGNVRELENLIQRLAAIEADDTISVQAIERELSEAASPANIGDASLSDMMEAYMARYFAAYGEGLPPAGLHERIIREIEAPLINASLAATNGNQLKAADLLGINRNTLRSRIHELGLKVIKI